MRSCAVLVAFAGVAAADPPPHPALGAPILLPDLEPVRSFGVAVQASMLRSKDTDGGYGDVWYARADLSARYGAAMGDAWLGASLTLPIGYVEQLGDGFYTQRPPAGMFVGNLRASGVASVPVGCIRLGGGIDAYLGGASEGVLLISGRLYADPAAIWDEGPVVRAHVDARVPLGAVAVQLELALERWFHRDPRDRLDGASDVSIRVRGGVSLAVPLAPDAAVVLDTTLYNDPAAYDPSEADPDLVLELDGGVRLIRGATGITIGLSVPALPRVYLAAGVAIDRAF